ncbi:MAG: hypothetical protein GXP18_06155 [Gammaproteobacteria bacterium]|nr:hypothetical protein [Gammaproteobacteria bacterium]
MLTVLFFRATAFAVDSDDIILTAVRTYTRNGDLLACGMTAVISSPPRWILGAVTWLSVNNCQPSSKCSGERRVSRSVRENIMRVL